MYPKKRTKYYTKYLYESHFVRTSDDNIEDALVEICQKSRYSILQ